MAKIVITETDRQKAFAHYDQDESVNRVATLLFAGHWWKARKLRDEYDREKAQATTVAAVRLGPRAEELLRDDDVGVTAEPEVALAVAEPAEIEGVAEEEPEPEVWDITLQLSAARMDRILLGFTPQEKADAICGALQARLSSEG